MFLIGLMPTAFNVKDHFNFFAPFLASASHLQFTPIMHLHIYFKHYKFIKLISIFCLKKKTTIMSSINNISSVLIYQLSICRYILSSMTTFI